MIFGDNIKVKKPNLQVDVFDAETGELIKSELVPNNVTNTGRTMVAQALIDIPAGRPSHFGIGTSTTAVSSTQTALVSQSLRDVVTARRYNAQQATIQYYLGSNQLNGSSVGEVGLFNGSATSADMFSRAVHTKISKTSSIIISYSWVFNIST